MTKKITMSEKDILLAAHAAPILASSLGHKDLFRIILPNGKEVSLPSFIVKILIDTLNYAADGRLVTVEPSDEVLSTQKAADFLNVSRPTFATLLDDGHIPFHQVGNRRRVFFKDVIEYRKRNMDANKITKV